MDWNCSYEPGIPSKCESLACVDYVPALCTHRPSLLPMDYLVRSLEVNSAISFGIADAFAKVDRTWWFRGSKSRNKVSVGEPAEGSLLYYNKYNDVSFKSVWCVSHRYGLVLISLLQGCRLLCLINRCARSTRCKINFLGSFIEEL